MMSRRPSRVSLSLLGVVAAALVGVAPAAAQDNPSDSSQNNQNSESTQDSQYQGQNQYQDQQQQQDRRSDQSVEQQSQQSGDWRADQGQQPDDQSQYDQQMDNRRDEQQWSDQQSGQDAESQAPAGLGVLLSQSQQREGAEVIRVISGSPAQEAGLRVGDQILAINGQRLDSANQFAQEIRRMNPGDRVEIHLRRGGQIQTVSAQLDQRSEALDRAAQQARSRMGDARVRGRQQTGYRGVMQGDLQSRVDRLSQQVQRLANEISDLRAQLGAQGSRQDAQSYQRPPAEPRGPAYNDQSFDGDGSDDVSRAAGNTGRDYLRSRTNRAGE